MLFRQLFAIISMPLIIEIIIFISLPLTRYFDYYFHYRYISLLFYSIAMRQFSFISAPAMPLRCLFMPPSAALPLPFLDAEMPLFSLFQTLLCINIVSIR